MKSCLLFFGHHSRLVVSSAVGRRCVTNRIHHGRMLLGNHCGPTWLSALDNDGLPPSATAGSATADAASDAQNHYPNRYNNRYPHINVEPVKTEWESVLLWSLQDTASTTVSVSQAYTAVVRAPNVISVRS